MNVVQTLIEVLLSQPEDFLKVKETLTRIGIASRKENILYQSCHILHKQGKYYIVHFKELFLLDGRVSDFSDDDKARRNTIVSLLTEWDLVKLVVPSLPDIVKAPLSQIKILTHKEKPDWQLVTKYNIGRKVA